MLQCMVITLPKSIKQWNHETMKIAIVYDKVTKFGGAERILLALHEVWPDASLFTATYDRQDAEWAQVYKVHSSFLQHLRLISKRDEFLPFLAPFAFESFNFDQFEVVLSVTSAEAKAAITKPDTLHICYCLTPTRYLWSGYGSYLSQPGVGIFNPLTRMGMRLFSSTLRQWDCLAAERPNYYIAISKAVRKRLIKYYRREAEIIYPPVDLKVFKPNRSMEREDFFLIVARLVPYKRIDYVISAFNRFGWKLKILGRGIDEKRLRNMAKGNIEFLGGKLTDQKVACYYQKCQALIFPGEEDFGLTAVEAQACGRPVIAFAQGGSVETVIDGVTGELYKEQTEEALIDTLYKFKKKQYSPLICSNNAKRFSKEIFKRKMKKMVEKYYRKYKKEK